MLESATPAKMTSQCVKLLTSTYRLQARESNHTHCEIAIFKLSAS
jgi:hypothetical protein